MTTSEPVGFFDLKVSPIRVASGVFFFLAWLLLSILYVRVIVTITYNVTRDIHHWLNYVGVLAAYSLSTYIVAGPALTRRTRHVLQSAGAFALAVVPREIREPFLRDLMDDVDDWKRAGYGPRFISVAASTKKIGLFCCWLKDAVLLILNWYIRQ